MKYAMFMLEHDNEVSEYCSKTIKERKKLCKLFKSAKLKVLSSQGNWIHIEQTDAVVKYFTEKDIHVKYDITLPGVDTKWIRMSVGPGLHKIFGDFVS
jgi:histidinol-phosphate/aromatic aminotransferase/cobyric acid decarboxylase-like protein